MSKSKGASLTGGTGDVNPQFYRLLTPLVAASTGTGVETISGSSTYPLPINRLGQKGGKAVVIELLKCRWGNLLQVASNIAQNAIYNVQGILSTKPPGPTGLGVNPWPNLVDPTIIDYNLTTNAIGANNAIAPAYRYDRCYKCSRA